MRHRPFHMFANYTGAAAGATLVGGGSAAAALCACLAAATVAGRTIGQWPVAPSGPSTFDRSWNAALGAADDLGVSVTSDDRTSGIIYGTTSTDNVTTSVLTQADGRVRVEFNVKTPAGYDTDLANGLHRAYEARMGR